MSKTKIHMVKTVLEILTSLLENLGSTSYILLPTFWACLALYVAWYFTSAGRLVPLTNKEATLLWKIHKNTTLCNAARWSKIKRKNKIVGFQCACGYKHVQKRLVRDKPPPGNLQLQAPSSGSYIPYINSPPQSLQKTVATLQSSMSNSQK